MSFAERIVLRDFEAWYIRTVRPDDSGALDDEPIEVTMARLEELFETTARRRVDVLEPAGVAQAIDLLLDDDEFADDDAFDLLDTLDLFVHFRLDTAADTADWEGVHDLLEEAIADTMEDPEGIAETLADAIAAANAVPEELRRRALAQLPPIAGVRELLEWIGTSRPITGSGALRRADIEPVAAMLGVRAVGVAKRPDRKVDDAEPVYVSTMWELPSLAVWWEALDVAAVLEITASRVRPGGAAAQWLAEDLPPLELAEKVVGMLIASTLTRDLRSGVGPFALAAARRAVNLLLDALDEWDDGGVEPSEEIGSQYAERSARGYVAQLEDLALLTRTVDGALRVPVEIAAAVAKGISLTIMLAGGEDLPDAPDAFGAPGDGTDRSVEDLFADPEVQAQMAELGIVHTPGMAAQLMGELAPLLREEGVDLDDLGDTDLETMNAALARATERHNLMLSTPVGAQHEHALTVLRLLSEALEEGSDAVAGIVLNGIPSDPEEDRPSVAQVIGVGMSVLDRVHGASPFSAGVARSRIPQWTAPAQAAAGDILDAARRGGAFAAIDGLIRRYRGKAVLEGVALAVSATVAARAAQEGVGLREMAERLVR